MATSLEYVQFVKESLCYAGDFTYRKMFGEYMLYQNGKPLLLVCDNTVYVKMIKELAPLLTDCPTGLPYPGAKPHYILDIESPALCKEVIALLQKHLPLPKQKR